MDEFTQAVDDGLRLSKRICYNKDRYAPPKPMSMDKSSGSLCPTSTMLYAIIYDPGVVDNPDLPSYQPHVHGRMDPPALIPLEMMRIELDIECYLDTAIVTVRGSWRLHCVMGSRNCDCLLVVPMGEQGSLLGVEADVSKKSYYTQIDDIEEDEPVDKPRCELASFLKFPTFSLSIPKVTGGSVLSIKANWVQKLPYRDGEFCIRIPFSFPKFVNPFGKVGRERIKTSVNSGTGKEVICQTTSHALKEMRRQSGTLDFSYDSDVITWSTVDFQMSYTVYSSSLFGGVILQQPSLSDFDQREMFCIYLFPESNKQAKVFRKEVIFIIDKSESLREGTLESTANALSTAITKLSPEDSFNIIAFNDETSTFSSSLVLATDNNIKDATQWMHRNFVPGGGTNIMQPLDEACQMLSDATGSVPHIFLITDGSVEDERNICSAMLANLRSKEHIAPRISTFGLGLFCNHYFLRMLATISRGQYDVAFDADSVETRMQSLIDRVLSPLLVDINIDIFDDRNMHEVFPFPIPDLLHNCPLLLSGRFEGSFPESIKATGILADMTTFTFDIKAQKIKDIPLDKVFIRQQIDLLTAQAWLSDSKHTRKKVTDLSKQWNVSSEYCHVILHQREELDIAPEKKGKKTKLLTKHSSSKSRNLTVLGGVNVGFGDITATAQNFPTGFVDVRTSEASNVLRKAIGCCSNVADCLCCLCCIRMCSRMSDRCVIVATQACSAFACLACVECCCDGD